MRKWVHNILKIQNIDMRMRELEVKYRTIPQEKARLKEELMQAQTLRQQVKEKQLAVEGELKKAEAETNQLHEKIRKLQTQSIMVKKNDEYQTMMADIASTNEKISEMETLQLELMDKVEAAKKTTLEAEKNYTVTEKSIRTEVAEFAEVVEEIKKEVIELKQQRKHFLPAVELKVLDVYTRILSSGNGKPVVTSENGSCGNCLLKLPPQTINEMKKGGLVLCDNCSHILYDPEVPEE